MLPQSFRFVGGALMALALAGAAGASQTPPTGSTAGPSKESMQSRLDKSSRHFIRNVGQWSGEAEFLARSAGLDVWTTKSGVVFDQYRAVGTRADGRREGHRVRMRFVGAGASLVAGVSPVAGKTEFVAKGQTSRRVAGSFKELSTSGLYPGVTMRTYFDGQKPRYDLVLAPSADPSRIAMTFDGAQGLQTDGSTLTVGTKLGGLKQSGLVAYQVVGGKRVSVPVSFKVAGSEVRFALGAYDHSKALTIDPLVYGSYYGGNSGADVVQGVVSDGDGGVYLTGYTESIFFPAIFGPYGYELNGARDAFITKLQGDAYLHDYAAYFGGSGLDEGKYIQLDPFGNVWIAGRTDSFDFPTTSRLNVKYIRRTTSAAPFRAPPQARRGGEAQFEIFIEDTPNGRRAFSFDADPIEIQRFFENYDPSLVGQVTVETVARTNTYDRYVYRITTPVGVDIPFTVTGQRLVEEDVRSPNFGVEYSQGLSASLAIQGQPSGSWATQPSNSRVQLLLFRGSDPFGGTFSLGYRNPADNAVNFIQTPLGVNATAAQIDTAIESLAGIGANNVTVTAIAGGFQIQFGGTIVGPVPHLLVRSNLQPSPVDYRGIVQGDLFLMKWNKDATTFLNPLPTEVTFFGTNIDDEFLNGMAIQQIPNAPAGTPFDIVVAGSTKEAIPEVADVFNDRVSGYLLRYRYVNGGLEQVSAANRYLSGSATVVGRGVALDSFNNAYVTGTFFYRGNASTDPTDSQYRNVFTTTSGTFENARLVRNTDVFVRKYAPSGSLSYSVFLGGNGFDVAGGYVIDTNLDEIQTGSAIAVDPQGNAYVTGVSTSFNFPRTRGVYGEVFTDAPTTFVTKLTPTANAIIYSTNLRTLNQPSLGTDRVAAPTTTNPLGNGATVKPAGIAIDSRGNAYVSGNCQPRYLFPRPINDPAAPTTNLYPSIPTTADALDPLYEGPAAPRMGTTEGFLTVLNPTATGLVHSTYLGGIADETIFAPYVDNFGDVWVFGSINEQGYSIFPLTGPPTIFPGQGQLPASLLTPTAFKPVGDEGPDALGVARAYGLWGVPEPNNWRAAPPVTGTADARDGFLVKIRVAAPTIASVVVNPANVPGGFGATATVTATLSQPAPVGGADIVFVLNNGGISSFSPTGPQDTITVTVPGGETVGTATITTSGVNANTQVQVRATYQGSFKIAQFTVVPWLQQFTITPTSVVGGNEVTGRIVLAANAPANGVVVQLATDDGTLVNFPGVTNGTFTIPAGQNTASFRIGTEGVLVNTLRRVRVTILGVTLSQDVTLTPAGLLSITFNPARVPGGDVAQGLIRLNGRAAVDTTATVNVLGDSAGFSLIPGPNVSGNVVTIRRGASSAAFGLTTPSTTLETQRTVTATIGSTVVSTVLTLFPDPVILQSLTLNPTTVTAGATSTGTITLASDAPVGGVNVALTSSDPSRATVPATVRVDENQRTGTFEVRTVLRADAGSVTITASRASGTLSAVLNITGSPFAISFDPSSVLGGATSRGTVTIGSPAPAGGIVVNLRSADPSVTVPATVTIAAGERTVTFTANTTRPASTRVVAVTATSSAGTSTGNLEVRTVGLASLTVSPTDMRPGVPSTVRVTLEQAAVTDTVVTITGDANLFSRFPRTITVRAGQTTATDTIISRRFARPLRTKVSATVGGSLRTVFLNLLR